MTKRLVLAAAALVVLGVAIAGFAISSDKEVECPEVSSSCSDKVNYLYLECNLFLYDPESGNPVDLEDLVAECQADTNEWVKAIMNCIAVFCPDGCAKVGECIDAVTGDDDDDTADDDATDDDWLDDDDDTGGGDDDGDDLWDDDEGDDDTAAPTPAPKSDDDDDGDPSAWCA